MDLRDLQQAGFSGRPDNQNATIFDKQRQVPVIINALNPANTISASGKLIRANRLEFDPARRSTSALNVSTPTRSSVYLVLAFLRSVQVTPVTLSCHDGFRHRQRMLQRQIAKLTRRAGVGFLVAVFDGKPTAHQQVKAHQLAVSAIATKFMSLACRSISFCGGITTVVLNLRGR